MTGFKKATLPLQSTYNSLYVNPLTDVKHSPGCSQAGNDAVSFIEDKENAMPSKNLDSGSFISDKENSAPADNNDSISPLNKNFSAMKCLSTNGSTDVARPVSHFKSLSTGRDLKPTSLQFCMQMDEPDKSFGLKLWDKLSESENSSSLKVWDYSDSEAAPASSWSTLPNRALLYRPLPMDIGRCTCVIVKEASPEGLGGGALYSLYTNEGKGRQNRKLAVAYHRRRSGKSEFVIAQNTRGIKSHSDESFIGIISANFMGSKYQILNKKSRPDSISKESGSLLAVVTFMPTISTWSGSYRSMRVYIPKHHSMILKNSSQTSESKMRHIRGLPKDWEEKIDKVHKLFSRIPQYNNISKQYELDFRDRGRPGLKIQSSVKNFQLALEGKGKQTMLQLGRVGKSKYVMDFRYPLTGFQAFYICLASIDSKLCCTV